MKYHVMSAHGPMFRLLAIHSVGQVHSLHPRAVNLLFGDTLLTLVMPDRGNGPGNLVCVDQAPFTALGWTSQDPVWAADGAIYGPGGHTVRWAGAAHWEPPLPPPTADPAVLRENRDRLADALSQYGNHAGLLPAALAVAGGTAPQTSLSRFAGPRVQALMAGDPDGARGLIGLGPGLTPSGDDLLAGYAVTLHRAGRPITLLGNLAPNATTLVSWHLLRWADRGLAGEHALTLTDGILSQSGHAALAALGRVLAHGATSGSDWAAGALLALIYLTWEA